MGFFDKAFNIVGDIGTAQLDMATQGGFSNAKGVQNANDQNAANAQTQMNFQERMSNTGYQRATADMRAAGLNPALAYQNGPASAPSGAMATAEAVRKGDIGAGLGNTAKQVVGLNSEVQQRKTQAELNTATAANVEQTRKLNVARTEEAEANAKITKNEREISDIQQPARKKYAPYDAHIEKASQALGAIGSAAGVYKDLRRGRRSTVNGIPVDDDIPDYKRPNKYHQPGNTQYDKANQ